MAARCTTGATADALRLRAAGAASTGLRHALAEELLAAVQASDPASRVEAAVIRSRTRWHLGDPDGCRAAIEEGLEAAREARPDVAARMLVEASRRWIFVDWEPAAAVAAAETGLSAAQAAGIATARGLMLLGLARYVADDPDWLAPTVEALAVSRAEGDVETELLAANNLVTGHESSGDPEAGRALAREMIERSGRVGMAAWQQQFQALALNLDLHAGELRVVVERAVELLDEPLDPRTRRQIESSLAIALIDLGRFELVDRRLEERLAELPSDDAEVATIRWAQAESAYWAGRPALAVERAREALAAGFPDVFAPLVLRWALVELGREPGDPVQPHAMPLQRGAQDESRALLALSSGRDGEAAESFGAAAEQWAPYHRRAALRSELGRAEALRRAGALDEARAILERLEIEALERGMTPLLGRIRRALRSAGVRRATRPPRTAAAGVTGREREVLQLVASGLTTPEIAARLGVSRTTVTSLVRSAMTRLGARSRGQAAALIAG